MNQIIQLQRQGKYIEAMKLSKQLERQQRTEKVRMKTLMKDMSADQVKKCALHVNTMIVLCDVIESISIDLNSILRQFDSAKVEQFDAIIAMGKEAKRHVKTVSEVTDNEFQCSFGDHSDELRTLIESYLHNKMKGGNQ